MAIPDRIDGWKAIGAHFGRDRTTVMRWARERGLPVKRLPGGKTGTVYALRAELDHWAAGQPELNDPSFSPDAPEVPARGGFAAHRWKAAVAGVLLAGLAGGGLWLVRPRPAARPGLPADPEVGALYLQARDDWAQRTPDSLRRAVAGLEATTRRDPGFAPAWSSLADAYLLSREFGALPDATAFSKAETAVDKAIRLNPDLPEAHRARGFILYWWRDRPRDAGQAFRRALALAPENAQNHFWYGNILADNGQFAAGLRELNGARLRDPGSLAIQTDLAWAQWSAGDEAGARQSLNALAHAHPDFAVIHDCLRNICLADGDYVGYVQALGDFARLRQDDALLRHAGDLRQALEVGAARVHRLLLDHALAEIAAGTRRIYRLPVLLASVAQDRQQTLAFLKEAERRHESWGGAGIVARIVRLWMGDADIIALIRRRSRDPVE